MGLCANQLYAFESMATAHMYLLDMQDMALSASDGGLDAGEDHGHCRVSALVDVRVNATSEKIV